MDYANTTNVEFIVDPKVLFRGWLIYSYLHQVDQVSATGECADWFFDNIMTWSYCFHKRYSMPRKRNSILIDEVALNGEPVPLNEKLWQMTATISNHNHLWDYPTGLFLCF